MLFMFIYSLIILLSIRTNVMPRANVVCEWWGMWVRGWERGTGLALLLSVIHYFLWNYSLSNAVER